MSSPTSPMRTSFLPDDTHRLYNLRHQCDNQPEFPEVTHHHMAPGSHAFYCLWQEECVFEGIYELLPNKTYFRLANSACCDLVTKRLFLQTHLTFTASSFTKASRIQALSRIAHHIQHLTFTFANSEATFLPPLVHPVTSDEISFLYMPYTHMALS